MWFKKLFNSNKSSENESPIQEESSRFQIEETVQQSHPLIDLTPDLRYNNLVEREKHKLPFPQTLLHETEVIFVQGVSTEDGFTAKPMTPTHNHNFVPCKVVATDRQLILCPNVFVVKSSQASRAISSQYLDISYGNIQKMELKEVKKQSLKLHFVLKDNRELVISNIMGDRIKELQDTIQKFGFVKGINKFYAFQYRKLSDSKSKLRQAAISEGWKIYDTNEELSRQGALKFIKLSCAESASQSDQKFTYFKQTFKSIDNTSFSLSPTYPKFFVIPQTVTSEELQRAVKFRTRERVPSLTYLYEYKPESYCCIFRCSQIKTGLMGNRSEDDERLVKAIVESINEISKVKKIHSKQNLKIYDARGYYAALGNMLAGKGYEKEDTYNCEVQFLNIPNIHAVRDSYNKIKAVQSNLYECLVDSGWIQYAFLILAGAKSMAIDLLNGKNVLVHCSDGWDRTSQLSSLSQLLLDPYYRTFKGFAVLIEKDWRHFGHKFRERIGQFHSTDYHPYEKSPVFIQFLDCVYQIQHQFPLSFQFNHKLLEFLAKNVDSNVYGTFLTNNAKEAQELRIQKETISIWTDALYSEELCKTRHKENQSQQQRQDFKESRCLFSPNPNFQNPFYQQDLNCGFLNVSLEMKNMKVWSGHLLSQNSSEDVASFIYMKEKQINKTLRGQFQSNQDLIEKLRKEASCLQRTQNCREALCNSHKSDQIRENYGLN